MSSAIVLPNGTVMLPDGTVMVPLAVPSGWVYVMSTAPLMVSGATSAQYAGALSGLQILVNSKWVTLPSDQHLAAGLRVRLRCTATNTGSAPIKVGVQYTIYTVDSKGAKAIVSYDEASSPNCDCIAGDGSLTNLLSTNIHLRTNRTIPVGGGPLNEIGSPLFTIAGSGLEYYVVAVLYSLP